MRNIYRYCTYQ